MTTAAETTTDAPLNLPDTIEWNGLTLRLSAGYSLPATSYPGVFTVASAKPVDTSPAAPPSPRTVTSVLADLNAAREVLRQMRVTPGQDSGTLHDQHYICKGLEDELAAVKSSQPKNPK